MVELQVHLTERLLHVQNVLGRRLQQAATVPPKGTDGTDPTGWLEAGPQQSCQVQILFFESAALLRGASSPTYPQPQIHIIAQLQFLPFLSERSSVGRFQAVRGAGRFSVSATSAPPPASETLAEKTRKSRQPDDTDRPTDG